MRERAVFSSSGVMSKWRLKCRSCFGGRRLGDRRLGELEEEESLRRRTVSRISWTSLMVRPWMRLGYSYSGNGSGMPTESEAPSSLSRSAYFEREEGVNRVDGVNLRRKKYKKTLYCVAAYSLKICIVFFRVVPVFFLTKRETSSISSGFPF